MHPETGFEEVRTSNIIIEELTSFGFDVITNIGKTGVVGTLTGNNQGKTIGLRADMDALNMQEETNVSYASTHPGKMHSCGHDTHVAMLLGACKYFSENKDKINGTLKVFFQAAEEGPMPGGGIYMVKGGHLDDVDAVFGQHIVTRQKSGTIAVKKGEAMAAPDELRIEITGEGTHASAPQTGVDPILTTAQVIQALQTIVSRNISPVDSAVISITTIHGGTSFNIIPASVTLSGTIRTLNEEVRQYVFTRIKEVVNGICTVNGATAKIDIIEAYPPVINDDKMTDFAISVAKEFLGEEHVTELTKPSMGGEDFAYYLQKTPGSFLWLGAQQEGEPFYNNHNPKFDIDESALLKGVGLHINLVTSYLSEHSPT